MTSQFAIEPLLATIKSAQTMSEIGSVLDEACRSFRLRYYAIVQHADRGDGYAHGIRIHNYPAPWAEWFDQERLGLTDPVHRASHISLVGFRWSSVPDLIPLSMRDSQILDAARRHGLGEGFTVPAHVPGELLGSCSFAVARGDELDQAILPYAQLAGQFAFEATRQLTRARAGPAGPTLTDRQIECILWVGRGKTDWEIAQILGVSHNTVIEHLRNARSRYAAVTRSMLPVRALYDGSLSFADILRR